MALMAETVGLVKPRSYSYQDSPLAEFCLVHQEQKKLSSEKESSWQTVSHEAGLRIWRIKNFKVIDWPSENYGKFYSGDSYIILKAYQRTNDTSKVSFNIHCWIGAYSTPDEYVTAAFKTAELGAYLNGNPMQYREIQGHESDLLLSYFPEGIKLRLGGAKSGLRQTKDGECLEISKSPENEMNDFVDSAGEDFDAPHNSPIVLDMETQLYRVTEDGNSITFKLVNTGHVRKCDLDENDVFVIETGRTCFVWIGKMSSINEKYNGILYAHDHLMSTANPLRTIVVIREGQTNEEFTQLFIE